MVTIRDELPADHSSVFGINSSAFESPAEALLVDKLRSASIPRLSLVAELDSRIVGHIMFTPVSVGGALPTSDTMGLAPMAVLPAFQGKGVGSLLVQRGLERCRQMGARLVFVLGHPEFYPRFGFVSAAPEGLHFENHKLDPYFFVHELVPGALSEASGDVKYHSFFSEDAA
jgi:putative acetyltransferase